MAKSNRNARRNVGVTDENSTNMATRNVAAMEVDVQNEEKCGICYECR